MDEADAPLMADDNDLSSILIDKMAKMDTSGYRTVFVKCLLDSELYIFKCLLDSKPHLW